MARSGTSLMVRQRQPRRRRLSDRDRLIWGPNWDPKLPETGRISGALERTIDPLTPKLDTTRRPQVAGSRPARLIERRSSTTWAPAFRCGWGRGENGAMGPQAGSQTLASSGDRSRAEQHSPRLGQSIGSGAPWRNSRLLSTAIESCTGLAIENVTLYGGDEPLVRRFLLSSCSLSLRG